MQFRKDIEGLRAVAVLLVVGFHCDIPFLAGGYVGVDVFFVISGFLIGGILIEEMRRSGRISLSRFYARRARRLLPAATLVIAATLLAASLFYSPAEQLELARTGIAATFYVSNIWFMRTAADYFAADVHTNPLIHTWSLAVEEQFYLVWPILLYGLMKAGCSTRTLTACVAAFSLLSLLICILATDWRQPVAFYAPLTRAWEFGAGVLCFLFADAAAAKLGRWSGSLRVLGLLMIGASALLFEASTAFPGYAALLPILGTAAVITAGDKPDHLSAHFLSHPLTQRLGRLSYSWYLWHWPLLVFAGLLVPSLPIWGKVSCSLAALMLAAATYHFIENPVRYNRVLADRKSLSFLMAGGLSLLGAGAGAASFAFAYSSLALPQQQEIAKAAAAIPDIYNQNCITGLGAAQATACVSGVENSSTTVVLVGDSHAAHWFPAIESVALQREWRLLTLIKPACALAEISVYSSALRREYRECYAWREAAIAKIAALDPYLVVVGSSSGYLAHGKKLGDGRSLTHDDWQTGMHRVLKRLSETADHVVYLREVPRPGVDAPNCIARARRHRWYNESDCSRPRSTALDREIIQVENHARAGLDNVYILDLSDRFCSEDMCYAVIDGQLVFRDRHHLTVGYAALLAPLLGRKLDQALQRGGQYGTPDRDNMGDNMGHPINSSAKTSVTSDIYMAHRWQT